MVDSKKNYKFDLGVKGLSDSESKTKVGDSLGTVIVWFRWYAPPRLPNVPIRKVKVKKINKSLWTDFC